MKGKGRKLAYYLLLVSFLFQIDAQAQREADGNVFFVAPAFRAGPILDIYSNLPDHGWAFSAEVNLGWQTTGRKYWHEPMKFPQLGILAAFTSLGNPDTLGNEYSLVPNLTYRIASFGPCELSLLAGFGFAWFDKPYDRINNPDNKFIGSRLTNKTMLGVNLDTRLGRSLFLSGGFEYLHYSNGHYQLPNVGINIPSFHLGLKYFVREYPESFISSDSAGGTEKKWLFNVRLGLGIHEFGDPVKPTGGPWYPVYNGSLYLSRRLGPIMNLHLGLHMNYYTSFYDYLAFNDLHEGDRTLRSMSLIAFGGLELLLGHFSFTGQMGAFLYNPTYAEIHDVHKDAVIPKEKLKRILSLKFGASWYLLTTRSSTRLNPWIGIFIKSNAGQADFSEISIGCAF